MKRFNLYIILLACTVTLFSSCEDYLEKSPDANLTEQQVFSSYRTFQGFVDDLYGTGLISYFGQALTDCFDMGDDVCSNKTFPVSYAITMGDYMWLYRNNDHNPFVTYKSRVGLWDQAWVNIRRCNQGLENMKLLLNYTDEEYNVLKGQMLFFRAWNHFEVARLWGGIPYLTTMLNPSDDMKLPRLSYKATLMKVVEDLSAASELLPKDWDRTNIGAAAPGSNTGRITKGAALALMSRALLYAASPQTTKMETGAAIYDKELCEQAAKAAYEVIKLATMENLYSLTSWDDYGYNFADTRATSKVVYTSETIFAKLRTASGSGQIANSIGRIHLNARLGGNGVVTSPTVNFVDLYETATGYAIEDAPKGDLDPLIPWKGRDPRLMKTILVDGVQWIAKAGAKDAQIQLYSSGGGGTTGSGIDRLNTDGSVTGYLIRKYTPYKVNKIDTEWTNFRYHCPYIRLAEMYLNYAEAVNEITSSPTAVPSFATLSAAEAINTIRRRVKLPVNEDVAKPAELQVYGTESLPDVLSKYTGSSEIFRERIRNERSVELAFEGHRFGDLRRWYVSHLPKHKIRYEAKFDKDHTFYRKEVLFEGKFDEKHYWFPFRKSHVEQYAGFKQNPGWE